MVRRKKSRPGQAAAALGGKAQPSALAFQGTIVSGSAASIFVDGGSGKGKSSSSSSSSSGNGHRRLDRGDRGGKGGSGSSRPRRRKLPDFMTPEKRAAGLRVKQAAGRSPGLLGSGSTSLITHSSSALANSNHAAGTGAAAVARRRSRNGGIRSSNRPGKIDVSKATRNRSRAKGSPPNRSCTRNQSACFKENDRSASQALCWQHMGSLVRRLERACASSSEIPA